MLESIESSSRRVFLNKFKKPKNFGNKSNSNLLINGDNLIALKALKQEYRGKVDCIYIDPPYNSGNKLSHYNDFLKHENWLLMMKERLVEMWDLLSEKGSLWISIDDSEFHYLKVLCDSIFGRDKFVTTIVWNQRTSRENRRVFSVNHEYILLYAKNLKKFSEARKPLNLTQEILDRYKNPDNDPRGPWQSVSMNVQSGHGTKDQFYVLKTPSGKKHILPEGRCWVYTEKKFKEEVSKGNIWFGKNGLGVPRIKKFLKDANAGVTPHTLWMANEVGTNDEAKKELKTIFKDENIFETPKPERLISRIIEISTEPNDLVLDAFLGSGTTAAVAHKMNRRWIGIEVGDHCLSYCVTRLSNIISGTDQAGISKDVKWNGGGGFKYIELSDFKSNYLYKNLVSDSLMQVEQ